MRIVQPVSPGEMLEEEFLKQLGLSKFRMAKDIGVPAPRIGEIVAGRSSVKADTDLWLCRNFGLSDGWWLRGHAVYETAIAKEAMQKGIGFHSAVFAIGRVNKTRIALLHCRSKCGCGSVGYLWGMNC